MTIQLNDATAKGNTCDDANDAVGCIFTLNLLTPAVTENDIKAAVAGAGGAAAGNADAAAGKPEFTQRTGLIDTNTHSGCNAAASTVVATVVATAAAGAATGAAQAASGTVNVQAFSGSLGGPPPPVESTAGADRPFNVNGATFLNAGAAIQRSCAIQKNACANAANAGQLAGGSQQCDAQEDQCRSTNNVKKARRGVAERRQAKGLDFGSCGSPAIKFAVGLDGRKEASFQSANNADFNHGSALNIKVIADFTCQRLASSCKAADAAVQACKSAAGAAASAKGQAAADAFNSALGVSV